MIVHYLETKPYMNQSIAHEVIHNHQMTTISYSLLYLRFEQRISLFIQIHSCYVPDNLLRGTRILSLINNLNMFSFIVSITLHLRSSIKLLFVLIN